jgi:4-hydroxyacetophenone monooxygenase
VLRVTEDDEAIRAALTQAELPALLPALAYVTGDLSLLRDDLRPDPAGMLLPDAGYTPAQLAEGRAIAFDALRRFRDGGAVPVGAPGEQALRRMVEFTVGGADMDEYLHLFREELAVEGEDLRAPQWTKATVAPETPFRVVVVGAGMSGLVAAHRLHQAAVPFVVLEKNDDVGGTWLENTYPGCRVDVANTFYSYSFAQDDEWPQHFSSQDVLLGYFRRCADQLGLREHIRFGTEVVAADFDEDTGSWRVRVRTSDGTEETLEANALISAVGQLNRPSFPDIAGRETFAGASFHSARWDHDVDLRGKRVAVIGTGASAAQLIPVVADSARELLVFQRTANWLIPTPDYHDVVSDEQRWLFRHVPTYVRWYRFLLFWRNAEGLLPLVTVDPGWEPQEQAVSMMNEFLRQMLLAYLADEFADRPDLLAQVTPSYPPGAKRVIRDNGIWARTLKRDDVRLVTDPIAAITPTGVLMADGTHHAVDVIVYGTGFQASKFLMPMKVTGRHGIDLHEQWGGDARAYLGVTVPNFPNLFCLYGPNTNIVINGSIIYFSECEVQYVLGCIRLLLEGGHRALDCRQDVHDAYNARIDAANLERAWGVSTVNSWYKNAKGRVTQNWPFSLLEYWQLTREPDPADYVLL